MSFKLVHWNIRSVRSNGAWLRDAFFMTADVLALQETFLSKTVNFSIPGKVVYRADRPQGQGGGLLIAVNSSFPSSRLSCPQPPSDTEVLGVKVKVSPACTFEIINIYAPRGQHDRAWLQLLVDNCHPPFFIVGDFNAYHSYWGGQRDLPNATIVADWITNNDMCLVNTVNPTHISPKGTTSLIDLSLVSPQLLANTNLSIHPDSFDSDHFPVSLITQVQNRKPDTQVRHRFHWVEAGRNVADMLEKAEKVDYPAFQDMCQKALDQNRRSTRVCPRTGAPWWDSRCSFLLGQKRRHLRKARRHFSAEHWNTYKKLSARLRREIREARRLFWNSTCADAARSGSIYRILRTITNRDTNTRDSHLILLGIATDPTGKEEANAFANSYSRPRDERRIPLDFGVNYDQRMRQPFHSKELEKALQSSPQRSPGKDRIALRLLAAITPRGKDKLLCLLNDIWNTGNIPQAWKEAIVVPIPKPGKPTTTTTSYRPISLTSCLSKVFERMILNRLTPWILQKKIFNDYHHGFLPFRDCTTAVMQIYNDLSIARRDKLFVILIALDLTAAYDSVLHDTLAQKMLIAGIDGHTTRWIHQFITARSFQVRWRDSQSDSKNLNIGVPQGSVLSPLLFSIYLRDIYEAFDHQVKYVTYADDIFVYAADTSYSQVMKKLQNSLTSLAQWGKYHNLRFNPAKCAALNISNKRSDPEGSLTLYGQPIPWVVSQKILGLHLAANLSWGPHFRDLKAKAFKKLNAFKCIASTKYGIQTRNLLQIAHATIIGAIHFGSPIHALACSSAKQTLEPILNAALRAATGLPRWTPILLLRRETKALSLNDAHHLQQEQFIIRHIALGEASPISAMVQNQEDTILTPLVQELCENYDLGAGDIIRWSPPSTSQDDKIQYITSSYAFQDKNLPPESIQRLFNAQAPMWETSHKMATDASKSADHTAVAYWDLTRKVGQAKNIRNINSVFTAEAFALSFALQHAPATGSLVLFTDSLSVTNALKNINVKSAKAILFLHRRLRDAAASLLNIKVIWVPGHKGISGNERADALARKGNRAADIIPWISPEDLSQHVRNQHHAADSCTWLASKYATSFAHLTRSSWEHRKLRLPRRGEVLLARLRTRTLPTRAVLHRFGLYPSPVCPTCQAPETVDHFLLDCRNYLADRTLLLHRLNQDVSTATFSALCDLAVSGAFSSRCLVSFLLGSQRF